MLVFVEFCKVPFVIFLCFILFLNGAAAMSALNFSCSFYQHLIIYLFPLYFANSPDEINSWLSEFFTSPQSYGLWPEMWPSDEVWRSLVCMSRTISQTLKTGIGYKCVLCTFLSFPDCCQKVSFNLGPPK